MAIKSYENTDSADSPRFEYHGLLHPQRIAAEAAEIEDLLKKCFALDDTSAEQSIEWMDQIPKIKHLNSFGKQILIRMFRSNRRFWGYKVDFNSQSLKPAVLFLVGTLCDSFDHMNTSPLYGLSVLDIGCGALSTYVKPDDDSRLIEQFYGDHPPIAAEILQMLGAKTVGVDPRHHCRDDYEYQVSYAHRAVEFGAIESWLDELSERFNVISCLNLFSRHSFLYHYAASDEFIQFFTRLWTKLMTGGLVYTTPPFAPSSEENCSANRAVFAAAGFNILHEGYYLILQRR